MSQHVNPTCNENDGTWLPLTEFAVKYGVSLSTLRRKIKTHSIPFRIEKGRYLLRVDGVENPGSEEKFSEPSAPKVPTGSKSVEAESLKMLSEAYEFVLMQKEESIRSLERKTHEMQSRVDELNCLIEVLEERYQVRY